MGEVYKAFDTRTQRVVALKVLPHHLAEDTTFQQRFRRESQAAAGVNDPHVVPIHGYGEIDGRLYLDMRLIEGRNLGTILADRDEPLGAEFGVRVVEQIGAALDASHRADLIHRDIKPSNILITNRDFVYLIDFGLARTAGESGMTTAGRTLGTLAYMAPERFDTGQADPRSDIYALTCVLYECLTGSRPYPADSLEQQIAGHMVSPPPLPSLTDPKLAAFDKVIAKGMAKKPSKRYHSAGQLAVAARRALKAPVPRASGAGRRAAHRARTSSGRWQVSRRTGIAAAAAVLLVSVSAFGAWQWRGETDKSDTQASVADPRSSSGHLSAPLGAIDSIAATVPQDIKDTGRLVIGVNVPYAPNEFRDAYGKLVGFDVDLMNAVARTLGLNVEYREVAFDGIIPAVTQGDFNLGMSSFTATKEREEAVDFVTYFEAGTLWAQPPGQSINPNDACGLRVAVSEGALQETQEIPAKSAVCVANGKPPIEKVVFARQDDVNTAVMHHEVDAMSADSPVTGFAIKTSGGKLEAAGEVFDSLPYGWPVPKGSQLAESLRQALEHVIRTGEYRTIATIWGVEKGMIDDPVIKGGPTG